MASKTYAEMLRNYDNYSLVNHKHLMPPSAHVSVSDNPLDSGAAMFRRSDKKLARWIKESEERSQSLNKDIRKHVLKDIEREISEDISMVSA